MSRARTPGDAAKHCTLGNPRFLLGGRKAEQERGTIYMKHMARPTKRPPANAAEL